MATNSGAQSTTSACTLPSVGRALLVPVSLLEKGCVVLKIDFEWLSATVCSEVRVFGIAGVDGEKLPSEV